MSVMLYEGLRDCKSLLQSQNLSSAVIPVKTGIQFNAFKTTMDSRFRGNDVVGFRVWHFPFHHTDGAKVVTKG